MSDIKFNQATLKTINRFPMLYKIQAKQVIKSEVHEAVRTTADAIVIASLITLVEEFGFGTNEQATRIHRFIKKLQETVDTGADYYEEAVVEGLKNRLTAHGLEYK